MASVAAEAGIRRNPPDSCPDFRLAREAFTRIVNDLFLAGTARSSLKTIAGGLKNMSRTRLVLDRVQRHGHVTLVGANAVATAHHALRLAMEQLGVAIVFDPSSAPDLVDALAIPAVDALQAAAVCATIGLLIGAFAGNAGAWAGAGAVIGGIGGAARGVQRVREGWRVRAVRDAAGRPMISITRGHA